MLRQYGVPVKPEEPKLLHVWQESVRWLAHFITPTFVPNLGKYHGPRRPGQSPGTSANWSGGVLAAPKGASFHWVHGDWTVAEPEPAQTDTTPSFCPCWVGIDGDQTACTFQAGIDSEVRTIAGKVGRVFYVWWEWFPEAEVSIANFPVAVGDIVDCTISLEEGSTTRLIALGVR